MTFLDRIPLLLALRFVWRSSPRLAMFRVALVVLQGVVPLGMLYCTKLIVDAIASGTPGLSGNIGNPGNPEAIRSALPPLSGLEHLIPSGLIDRMPDSLSLVMGLLVGYGALTIANTVITSLAELISIAQGQRIVDYAQMALHAKANELDLAYYENPDYHDMLERAEEEAAYRPIEVLENLFQLGLNTITLVGIAALLLSLHWGLTIVLLVAAIPAALVRMKYAQRLYDWTRQHTPLDRQAEYFSWLLTSDEAAKELRLFGLGSLFQERFRILRQRLYKGRVAIAKQRFVAFSLTQGLVGLITLTSYGVVILQTLQGGLLLGDLVLYHQAFQRGQDALRSLLRSISDLYESSLFIDNLQEFLDLSPIVVDPPKPKPFPMPIQGGIRCQDVSFSYGHSTRQALHHVNLTIQPGEIIALVGENGSGKTTLVKLLCRLYDPTHGQIQVDGIDLRHFALEEVRQHISVIFQDYTQYHLTAQENIWLGNIQRSPTLDSIQEASMRSGAHDMIQHLPQGYDTVLGKWFDQGEELSIGQWQAIALARAFLRPSQLIILDEPTSALDPRAEYRVFQKFRQLIQQQAAILITHRLSTVRLADRIYVMDQGTIVEQGSHDELMSCQGLYTSLYNTQARQYRL